MLATNIRGNIKISEFMTAAPHTIGHDQSISQALNSMQRYGVRHLPVLEAGELVGVISDRDVNFVRSIKDIDLDTFTVEEALSGEPNFAAPETPLRDVISRMADTKSDCTLVVEGQKVVGIFTEVDAYRTLARVLEASS